MYVVRLHSVGWDDDCLPRGWPRLWRIIGCGCGSRHQSGCCDQHYDRDKAHQPRIRLHHGTSRLSNGSWEHKPWQDAHGLSKIWSLVRMACRSCARQTKGGEFPRTWKDGRPDAGRSDARLRLSAAIEGIVIGPPKTTSDQCNTAVLRKRLSPRPRRLSHTSRWELALVPELGDDQ